MRQGYRRTGAGVGRAVHQHGPISISAN